MKSESQSGKNLEVNYPAPDVDKLKADGDMDNNCEKEIQKTEREEIGIDNLDRWQIPDEQEDILSEGDKMLLDYALLTSLY